MKLKSSFTLTFLLIACMGQMLHAQTLFTIDDIPVTVKEFEYVYTKNNINNQADYSKQSLEEYLDLYIKFRLKVREADALQMDTLKHLQDELQMYRKQLAKSYLNDKEVTENLVSEAYDRMKLEIDVSHILIQWPSENPTASDSAQVLKEINLIKKKANKNNFGDLAVANSDDPSAKENKGRLGYLTAFQTVYPFETAMYNTAAGKISSPVATQFGYHLVLVHDKREARGSMTTAHILIKSKETDTPDQQANAERTANTIYNEIQEGNITFEDAVKMHSQDKRTANSKGVLPELSSAEMLTSYADAAFALEKDGDIAAPVQTAIGWHIIKRISKKELAPFEEMEVAIGKKVERDSRSKVAEEIMIADTKSEFGYKNNKEAKVEIINALAKSFENGRFNLTNEKEYTKALFSIGSSSYSQNDFIKYIEKYFQRTAKQTSVEPALHNYYNRFETQRLSEYREDHLEEINEDFKVLMQEYHDGILLFELTNNEVWNKAVEDTSGLKAFYETNSGKYMWDKRIQYTTYTVNDAKTATKLKKYLAKGWNKEKILEKLNKKETLVKAETFKFEKEASNLNQDLTWVKGFLIEDETKDGKTQVTVVNDILDPMPKQLSETRGYVISDYQDYLEKNWIQSLQSKYEVAVNDEVFKSLIKK